MRRTVYAIDIIFSNKMTLVLIEMGHFADAAATAGAREAGLNF